MYPYLIQSSRPKRRLILKTVQIELDSISSNFSMSFAIKVVAGAGRICDNKSGFSGFLRRAPLWLTHWMCDEASTSFKNKKNQSTITDNSTFKIGENGIPTTGIPYVIVNGVIVVKDNEVLPVKAGQAIRYPVEPKGKFTPIDKDDWRMKHTIGVNPSLQIHNHDDSGAGALLNKKE